MIKENKKCVMVYLQLFNENSKQNETKIEETTQTRTNNDCKTI